MAQRASILLVDDDEANLEVFRACLKSEGYEVALARDGREAIRLLNRQSFDLVLTDMLMPNADGVELLAHVRTMSAKPAVIAMSGGGAHLSGSQMLTLAAKMGATISLLKPFSKQQLLSAIAIALEQR